MTPSCRLMDLKDSNILCIFAHPDDESYIVGGTIARAVNEGAEVTVISATKGDKGFQHIKGSSEKERLTHIREEELKNAAQILGVKKILLWDYPDGGLDNLGIREKELGDRLVEVIKKIEPDLILTFGPDGVSGHRDHIAIGALAQKAAHAYADSRGKNTRTHAEIVVYGVTIPREFAADIEAVLATRKKTTAHYHHRMCDDAPALAQVERVDIANFVEKKFAAMRAHSSQNPEGLIAAGTSHPKEFWTYEYFLPLL